MSITISGRVREVPKLVCTEQLGLTDLESSFDLTSNADWPEETIGLWRHGVSTRRTEVTREGNTMSVRVFSLASPEDVQLASDLLSVFGVEGPINADELGELESLVELDSFMQAESAYARAESGMRAIRHLIDDGRGPIGIPGPIRPVHIGQRMMNELDQMEGQLEINLLKMISTIQWTIDSKYEDAGVFQASPPSQNGDQSDEKWTIAMWLPDRNFIMPRVDRVAISAGPDDVFMIQFEHAAEVGGEHWNFIDECQATVDALKGDQWSELVSRARPFSVT